MYAVDNSTAVATLPTPGAVGPNPNGFFTGGTPGSTPGTIVDADWLNAVQQELINVIEAFGIVPNKTNQSQISLANALSSSPIGTFTNLSINQAATSTSMTVTADEIFTGTALGGLSLKLGNFNETINVATTGAGGMDTGAAPNNGFVAIYAIYNPTTQVAALLGTNATAGVAPSVYAGAHMPAGFGWSALLSVWPTGGSGRLLLGYQWQRAIILTSNTILATSTTGSNIGVNLATVLSGNPAVPPNAVAISGEIAANNSVSAAVTTSVSGLANGVGAQGVNETAATGSTVPYRALIPRGAYPAGQQIFYTGTSSAGTPVFTITVTGYEI